MVDAPQESDPLSTPNGNPAPRARLQFNLRTLFGVTIGCAVLFALIRWAGVYTPFVLAVLLCAACWLAAVAYLLCYARTAATLVVMAALFAVGSAVDTSLIATIVLMFVTLPVWPVAMLAWLQWKPAPWPRRVRRNFAIGGACLICIVSIPLTLWPLRISFAFSRPALEKLADEVQAGRTLTGPRRAGLFIIRACERNGTNVCLWTIPDRSGNTGFVRRSSMVVRRTEWTRKWLNENWLLVSED